MSFGYLGKSKKGLPRSEKPKKPYSKRGKQKWDGGWLQKLAVKELSQNDFLTRIEK
jgi:hypothetical protein